MEFMSQASKLQDNVDYLHYKEVAAEIATDKMMLAAAALKGDSIEVQDREGDARWKSFIKGLLIAAIGAYIYISLVGHFGLLISTALGRRIGSAGDPMGFVYATLLVSALAFAIAFFRTRLREIFALPKLYGFAQKQLRGFFRALWRWLVS